MIYSLNHALTVKVLTEDFISALLTNQTIILAIRVVNIAIQYRNRYYRRYFFNIAIGSVILF